MKQNRYVKIMISNKHIEQVKTFKCLRNISNEDWKQEKTSERFQATTKTSMITKIKMYKSMYGLLSV